MTTPSIQETYGPTQVSVPGATTPSTPTAITSRAKLSTSILMIFFKRKTPLKI
jgi:hypothetical protein